MNVGCIDIDGTLNINPQAVIDNCVNHFTTLNDDIRQAWPMLVKSVKGIGGQYVMIALGDYTKEEEVEFVLW